MPPTPTIPGMEKTTWSRAATPSSPTGSRNRTSPDHGRRNGPVAAAVAERIAEHIAALITTGVDRRHRYAQRASRTDPAPRFPGMPGLDLMLEREEGISLPPWMSDQFLATDPKVVAAEVKGFGHGKRVRASLGWCAPRRCSWSERQRIPKGRRRRRRRSCRQGELSPCRASGTSGRSSRASKRSRTRCKCCGKASRPDPG
jgi:hypothetical protein